MAYDDNVNAMLARYPVRARLLLWYHHARVWCADVRDHAATWAAAIRDVAIDRTRLAWEEFGPILSTRSGAGALIMKVTGLCGITLSAQHTNMLAIVLMLLALSFGFCLAVIGRKNAYGPIITPRDQGAWEATHRGDAVKDASALSAPTPVVPPPLPPPPPAPVSRAAPTDPGFSSSLNPTGGGGQDVPDWTPKPIKAKAAPKRKKKAAPPPKRRAGRLLPIKPTASASQ